MTVRSHARGRPPVPAGRRDLPRPRRSFRAATRQAASRALARAGFAPTPVSVQVDPDGTPTGTGNVTAMLARGYIEVLFKTADTPLGREFDPAITGHAGVHLAAFSVADAEGAHRRLDEAGFAMRPLVQFQRPVDTESRPGHRGLHGGAARARRDGRGPHPDARAPHRAHGLAAALAVTSQRRAGADRSRDRLRRRRRGRRALRALHRASRASPARSARRSRSTRADSSSSPHDAFALLPEIVEPRLPFMGAYAVRVHRCAGRRADGAAMPRPRRAGAALVVPFPPELGIGAWLFAENARDLPWRLIPDRSQTSLHRGRRRTASQTCQVRSGLAGSIVRHAQARRHPPGRLCARRRPHAADRACKPTRPSPTSC